MSCISLHNRFSHRLAVYFSRNGSRTNNERSSGSECSVPRDVPKLSQGARRIEGTHCQREEEEDKETNWYYQHEGTDIRAQMPT